MLTNSETSHSDLQEDFAFGDKLAKIIGSAARELFANQITRDQFSKILESCNLAEAERQIERQLKQRQNKSDTKAIAGQLSANSAVHSDSKTMAAAFGDSKSESLSSVASPTNSNGAASDDDWEKLSATLSSDSDWENYSNSDNDAAAISAPVASVNKK